MSLAIILGLALTFGAFQNCSDGFNASDESILSNSSVGAEDVAPSSPPTTPGAAPSPSPAPAPSPVPPGNTTGTLPAACGAGNHIREILVSTASELQSALNAVQPGDLIKLSAGNYKGTFTASRSGTSAARITVCGDGGAVLEPARPQSSLFGPDYGFYLTGDYWTLTGFTVQKAFKGIMLDGADHNILRNLVVRDIGMEAVHFRKHSSYNVIQDSTIENTGLSADLADYAEGVYVGSSVNNWAKLGTPNGDLANHNKILRNRIRNTTAEPIDIKEATVGTLVEGNQLDGSGLNGGVNDSLIDIKGSEVIIRGNIGRNSGAKMLHGFETHVINGIAVKNVRFEKNDVDVNSSGFGFNITGGGGISGVTLICDNKITRAGSGFSNRTCTAN